MAGIFGNPYGVNTQPVQEQPPNTPEDWYAQQQIKAQMAAKAKAAEEAAARDKMIRDYKANPGTAFNPNANPVPVMTGPDGRPMTPGYVSIGDDITGLLKDPYNLKNNLNTEALDQLRAETLRQGPSKWAQLQAVTQGDQIAKQNASNIQAAQNNLAATGGLRGGAAERLQTAGANSSLMASQNMRQNLATQDEQNRMTNLRALPGMEQSAAQYQNDINKYNIEGAKNEMLQRRAFDVNNYNEAMRGWAAQKAAAATPSGGKK